jgi:N6-L-threonylcarbamoyladenine synthase
MPPEGSLDLSFSGLKTSVRYFMESADGRRVSKADVAASFQSAVVDVLMDRVTRATAARQYAMVIVSGGVAANSALQAALREWGRTTGIRTLIPPPKYCTDNAAMIAAVAERQGEAVRADPMTVSADPSLDFEAVSAGVS